MPSLDQAPFIAQAVASVMDQGIPGLELLVQDGGSSDGTQAVLADLARRHPGLKWVSEPDGGPAEALNRAFARAGAPVIGWLNADDLYAPGAAARALAAFADDPELVMVYGEAQHIDADGAVIGPYPTRRAQATLAEWADGCHVCQPSVFLRREALDALGPLDETLRTAFDYEYWLRLLRRFPGRVGFVPQVQAQSRLHEGAITLRLREQVALEGLQVIHRHIGPAPAHWLLTHFGEVMAGLPFDGGTEPPAARLLRLVDRAEPWLAPDAAAALRRHVADHRALQLATAHFFAPVDTDGWAPPLLELRIRQPAQPFGWLRLRGRHASPRGGALRLRALQAGAPEQSLAIEDNGPFEVMLDIAERQPGAHAVLQLACDSAFVPAEAEPGSTDRRALAFVLEGATLHPCR